MDTNIGDVSEDRLKYLHTRIAFLDDMVKDAEVNNLQLDGSIVRRTASPDEISRWKRDLEKLELERTGLFKALKSKNIVY